MLVEKENNVIQYVRKTMFVIHQNSAETVS
jgi:hypothetical protein